MTRVLSALVVAAGIAGAGVVLTPGVWAQDAEAEVSVEALVRQLGDPDFDTREAAQQALVARGAEAVPALRAATEHEDPEVASRAREALEQIDRGGAPEDVQPDPELRQGNPGMQPGAMPDMDEVMRQMQEQLQEQLRGQLPEELGGMLEEMMRQFGEMDPDNQEQNGNLRVFRFELGGPSEGPSPQPPVTRPDPRSARLGLKLAPPSDVVRAQLGVPAGGLVVHDLLDGSYATEQGFERYDVILAVDGEVVQSGQQLTVLRERPCEVLLIRRAERQTISTDPMLESAPEQEAPAEEESRGRSF